MYIPQPDDTQLSWASGRDNVFVHRPLLPDWHELLAAFCGHIGDQSDDHPVTRWARGLAELHLERRAERGDPGAADTRAVDERRAQTVTFIDEWVARRARRRGTRAESLGSLIDSMAAAHVHAIHLLRTVDRVSDEQVHAAWYDLAELAAGWTDRAANVLGAQQRRAPAASPGIQRPA
ncbi:DUF4254 domain-containing protein [Nocardia sp. NBC_01503]|uniref:DUF4254 domain-containing protein n=1 Tax=Nocardia sp. NBC_01503 TaxID=2975997 RepID=UPI002E7BF4DF|nr:DUF4254 domain-containing protein [Nocardia sp. NBC_01503]WTL33170.1 DUF4254 domain-containing protein [Nocardia sp. NBC_01503]